MGDINNIVSITITRATALPEEESFNGLLIASEFLIADTTPNFSERVREYTSLSQITTEGFATSSPVYLAAKALFSQNPNPGKIYVGRKLTGADGSETWTEALTAMAEESNDWYGFAIGSRTLADLEEAADWAETVTKLFLISDDDSNIISGTGDIAEYANTNSYDRTVVIYEPEADLTANDPYTEIAWAAKLFPYDPGSATWALKTLAAVTASNLTPTQRSTLFGKEGNVYESVAGRSITNYGTVGSGEYIDIIHGTDWLESRIQTRVYTALLNNIKVPFTDAGIQSIVAEVQGALQEAVDVGLIIGAEDEDNGYVVDAPRAADVSATNKANRNLPDITFRATYQGAIHKTEITGTISV